jgi:hypothetical protein
MPHTGAGGAIVSTGESTHPSLPPQSPQPAVSIPPEVEQAAAQRGFGPLLDSRLFNRPVVTALVYLGIGVGCLLMLMLSSWLIGTVFHPTSFSVAWSILRIIPLAFCFGMVIAPVYALRILVTGSQSYYAYTNGLVYLHRRSVQAVAWPEVSELRSVIATRGDNAGKLLRYDLVPVSGSPVPLPLVVVNGRDAFLDHVIAALRHHGRPIN